MSQKAGVFCARDTDGDGDCHECQRRGGCHLSLFLPSAINAALVSPDTVEAFKKKAVRFEYREALGTVKGWRDASGVVLLDKESVNCYDGQ